MARKPNIEEIISNLWETNMRLWRLEAKFLNSTAILQAQIKHLQDQINELQQKGEKQ